MATQNMGKLEELRRIFEPAEIPVIGMKEAGCGELHIEETGKTFAENAFIKANAVCKATGMPAIADDSGLCVDALGGAPGVYSARYAGEDASNLDRIHKLLDALDGVPEPQRGAHFACALCAVMPNGDQIDGFGRCEGFIDTGLHGVGGFGYDPVFLMPDRSRTFGELTEHEKDTISHRGYAFADFLPKLTAYFKNKGL